MKSLTITKNNRRLRRKRHVRRVLRRNTQALRLSIFRSSKHISAQVIDDVSGRTLAHATSAAKGAAGDFAGKTKTEKAALVGAAIAEKARAAGVESVIFDRGSSKYHGRVKALAEAAREGGLKF